MQESLEEENKSYRLLQQLIALVRDKPHVDRGTDMSVKFFGWLELTLVKELLKIVLQPGR